MTSQDLLNLVGQLVAPDEICEATLKRQASVIAAELLALRAALAEDVAAAKLLPPGFRNLTIGAARACQGGIDAHYLNLLRLLNRAEQALSTVSSPCGYGRPDRGKTHP